VVYGIVRFAPGGDRQVLDIVITFATAAAADDYAAGLGWSDYEVAPARFFVRERPSALDTTPPPIRLAPPRDRSAADRSPDSSPGTPGTQGPPTGGPALPKQGHRPVSADPAGPPGSAETGETGEAGKTGEAGETGEGGKGGASAASPDEPGGGAGSSGSSDRPAVTTTAWGAHRWAVAVTAGSDPRDALRAVGRLPAGLVFTAAYGDADVVLVYGGPSEDPPPDPRPTVAEELLASPSERALWARWMTASERDAYRAGRDAALDDVRRALA